MRDRYNQSEEPKVNKVITKVESYLPFLSLISNLTLGGVVKHECEKYWKTIVKLDDMCPTGLLNTFILKGAKMLTNPSPDISLAPAIPLRTWECVQLHPCLVVMMARKRQERCPIYFLLGAIQPHGLSERLSFLWKKFFPPSNIFPVLFKNTSVTTPPPPHTHTHTPRNWLVNSWKCL